MKTKMTLLAMAAGVAIQATVLAGQTNSSNTTTTKLTAPAPTPAATAVTKTKPLFFTPLSQFPSVKTDQSITRVGNISSRAWTESVGWDPGKPSLADDSSGGREQGLPLLWIGHEPWR
jgi:hypothetical protein